LFNNEQRLALLDESITKIMTASSGIPHNFELSKQQLVLLKKLFDQGRASVTELSERLGLSVSATTISVDRLVRLGLIIRTRDEADRRVVWLELSDEALSKLRCFKEQRDVFLLKMLQHLSEEEADLMISLINKMTKRMT
jgi:DNA-binding MarR family transcriptional regulator